jgi:hypothetical protein
MWSAKRYLFIYIEHIFGAFSQHLQILAPSVLDTGEALVGGRHDYVAWKLCGTFVTDTTTASTTGLLDLSFQVMIAVHSNQWNQRTILSNYYFRKKSMLTLNCVSFPPVFKWFLVV